MGSRSPLTPVTRKEVAPMPTADTTARTPVARHRRGALESRPHQAMSSGAVVMIAARSVRLRCWWERAGSMPATPTAAEPRTRMTTAIHHRIGRRVPGVEESPGWDMDGMA